MSKRKKLALYAAFFLAVPLAGFVLGYSLWEPRVEQVHHYIVLPEVVITP